MTCNIFEILTFFFKEELRKIYRERTQRDVKLKFHSEVGLGMPFWKLSSMPDWIFVYYFYYLSVVVCLCLVVSRYLFCCKIDDLAEEVWSDIKIDYCLPSQNARLISASTCIEYFFSAHVLGTCWIE